MIELKTHGALRDLDEKSWERFLAPDFVPHMSWAFLDSLEVTGCLQPERGWLPQHITLHQDGSLVGMAPAYVKGNSEGEFVFDHSWARFCHESLGKEYYPKLIVAVPFTPATGARVLCAPEVLRAEVETTLGHGLQRIVAQSQLSGAHVLFPHQASANNLAQSGMERRYGVQYHWTNPGYQTFDDFLSRFTSKRRNQIRRERREMEKANIEIRTVPGGDLSSADIDWVYEFYRATVDKHYYGRRYLNREFFHEIVQRMPDNIVVVFARDKGAARPFAGAFNLVGGESLFGRYWGALEERPFLHFNVCYYAGIDLCIERKLKVFEPGAGGEHKHVRGFESTVTHSVHFLDDRRLRQPVGHFLNEERVAIEQSLASEKSTLKTWLGGEDETG